MIIISGSAHVSDANRVAFLKIGAEQVANSRREAGCVSYGFYEDLLAPGYFFFYEEWKDQAAVDFHFAQPYCLDFITKARALASTPPEIKIHPVISK